MSSSCNNSGEPSVPQRSEEGDARREAIKELERVFRGKTDELLVRLRRSSSGHLYVSSYQPTD